MAQVVETETFSKWLKGLRDQLGRQAILRRIARIASMDHFGDHAGVGDGVSELRIGVGPGYRVYHAVRGEQVVLLICGGDKVRNATSNERRRWPPSWNEGGEGNEYRPRRDR